MKKKITLVLILYSFSCFSNDTSNLLNTKKVPDIRIGGVVRSNYSYRDWSELSKKKAGDFNFELFGLNLDVEHGQLKLYN